MPLQTNKHILVTGGAGYVGAYTCKALQQAGFIPIAYDNLSNGSKEWVQYGPFEQGDINDSEKLKQVFADYNPIGIIHFAALIAVDEAERDPLGYWHNNVCGSLTLFKAAIQAQCRALVFSSTCAVYGTIKEATQAQAPLTENTAYNPTNAYGASKRATETMLMNLSASFMMRSVIFRYFNVAGADPHSDIAAIHRPATHLIPLCFDATTRRSPPLSIFGQDYNTKDGTCVRDYIHVNDIARAHVLALHHLLDGGASDIFNLGAGQGTSVKQIIQQVERITQQSVPHVFAPRRKGDAAILVADNTKVKNQLGWSPECSDIETIITDAWQWYQKGNAPA